jgi:hypothetical protein
MEPTFFDRLEQVQEMRPDLICDSDAVSDDYGIYRYEDPLQKPPTKVYHQR